MQVHERLFSAPWYKDIVYVIQTLKFPLGMDKSKVRYFKLVSLFSLAWKDPRGILLNCVEEDEDQIIMNEMDK